MTQTTNPVSILEQVRRFVAEPHKMLIDGQWLALFEQELMGQLLHVYGLQAQCVRTH